MIYSEWMQFVITYHEHNPYFTLKFLYSTEKECTKAHPSKVLSSSALAITEVK